ncbi:hypothetical protein NEAUS03_2355 [Nematocida ausubeli]|nr:hypothetical protein NEAUS03_2355 [Nematocida ausubeli]
MDDSKTFSTSGEMDNSVPLPITISILSATFSTAYPTLLSCIMSDPEEVFISLLAGCFAFIAIPGVNSKKKLIISCALSFPLFFIPEGYVRAFLIGIVLSYGQTVAEVHTAHLSLCAFRENALSQLGILLTMQTCLFFFFLSFIPNFEWLCSTFIFVLSLTIVEIAAIVFFVPDPPTEMITSNNLNVLYNEVYYTLTNLFGNTPFHHFHREYTEIVDRYNKKVVPLYLRINAVVEKVNVSFISAGVGGLLSTTNNNIYLVIFSCLSMFKWVFSNQHNKEYIILSMASIALVLLAMLAYNVKPIFIILIGMSLYLVPSSDGYLKLDKYLIGISNSIRNLLGVVIFVILWREQIID